MTTSTIQLQRAQDLYLYNGIIADGYELVNDEIVESSKVTLRLEGETVSTKELEVVSHFTNGFAENVLELKDGTIIFIGYHSDRVRIVERKLKG